MPGIRINKSGAATVSPDDKQDAMVCGDTRKAKIASRSWQYTL